MIRRPKFPQLDCEPCLGTGIGRDYDTPCRDCRGRGSYDDPDEVEAYEAAYEVGLGDLEE